MSAFGPDDRRPHPFGRFLPHGFPVGPPPAPPPPFPVEGEDIYLERTVSPVRDDVPPCPPSLPEEIGYQVAKHLQCAQVQVKQPAYLQPPHRAFPIIGHSQAVVNVTDGAWAQVLAIRVEGQQNATFRKLGMQLESGAAFTDVQWRIRFNGRGVAGWDNVRYQVGTLENPTEICLLCPPDTVVTVEAITLTAGIVHQARVCLHGWYVSNVYGTSLESSRSWMGG